MHIYYGISKCIYSVKKISSFIFLIFFSFVENTDKIKRKKIRESSTLLLLQNNSFHTMNGNFHFE